MDLEVIQIQVLQVQKELGDSGTQNQEAKVVSLHQKVDLEEAFQKRAKAVQKRANLARMITED